MDKRHKTETFTTQRRNTMNGTTWTHEEVKILVAFHKQHSTPSLTHTCEWCFKQVEGELNEVPLSIDEETGMYDEVEYVCDPCMIKHNVLHETQPA
jgi:hypothetical protein